MRTSNTNQLIRSIDSEWYLLAEYTLSKLLEDLDAGDEPTAEMLSQAARELGMPVECIHDFEKTMRSFTRKAVSLLLQENMKQTGCIRIFCQKKIIGDACSEKTSGFHNIEQAIGQDRNVRRPGLKIHAGWGYFFIERGETSQEGDSMSSQNRIDLYIYKEGKG